MAPKGRCRKCGEVIRANERAGYPIQGYEVERDSGGQNHVVNKTRVDGWIWHARFKGDCFDQAVNKSSAQQEAMF
jgi:hypothetical protein